MLLDCGLMMSKHNALSRRLEAMERKMPSPEELEARKHQEFLSKCSDDELNRLIVITKNGEWSSADIAFWEELVAKYEI